MTIANEQATKKPNWLWIGLGGAVLFCLCAVAVAVFLLYRAGKQLADGTKTDPVSAAKAAHEIADYDLPAGYQEQVSMNVFVYSFVMIAPTETNTQGSQPLIMLAQFETNSANQQELEQQIRQSFEQQAGNRGIDMKLIDIKKMTIRGQETDVATYEGTDSNGTSLRELITTFPGKNGTAMLIIMGNPEYWDQTMIDKFIKSMR